MEKYYCNDCGVEMNEGEAKTFTCCDACWDKKYPAESNQVEAKVIVKAVEENSEGKYLLNDLIEHLKYDFEIDGEIKSYRIKFKQRKSTREIKYP